MKKLLLVAVLSVLLIGCSTTGHLIQDSYNSTNSTQGSLENAIADDLETGVEVGVEMILQQLLSP